MLPAFHWAYSFSIGADDIDSITNLLLEQETPLSAVELATAIIKRREENERQKLKDQYKGTKVYRPRECYAVGDRLMFAHLQYATGKIVSFRQGVSPERAPITIAAVEFDEAQEHQEQTGGRLREFVVAYQREHPLNTQKLSLHPGLAEQKYSVGDILDDPDTSIVEQVNDALENNADLVRLAGTWFVRELMLEVDIGYMHLAEAVLDMHGGGPLPPGQILQEIGGIGDAPEALQVFSLNYYMNQDPRFDEVGPAGKVLWHLTSLLPRMVMQVPAILQYEPLVYDRNVLSREMRQLEYDLDDEHSPVKSPRPDGEVSVTLIFPHRRVGTLPINSETQFIFPDAKTPRIAITMVDALDNQEYPCWVVHEHKYVYGLAPLYQKYHLSVGAFVYLTRTRNPSRIEIEFENFKTRSEWCPVIDPGAEGQILIRNEKRAIGAEFDEMIIIGVQGLKGVDALSKEVRKKGVAITRILRGLVGELSSLNPQGTVHAKTLYSALNVLRRCPPGPMFATLLANPEFEYVGGNNWKLRD